MSKSKIEWTDVTWNPVAGCSIVSAGCTNCYAMLMANRLEAMGKEKYKGLTRKSGGRAVWTGVMREDHSSLNDPYKWQKPRNVFVNSMSDLFHPDVGDEFVSLVWKVMEDTPAHQYQILTKRPERMADFVHGIIGKVLPNVWLGTSVESDEVADRIDHLNVTPAAIKFVSFEPLIGSVGRIDLSKIDWAIVGGESGPGARKMKEEWIDEIHSLCENYDTAFFFKQWGAWGIDNIKRPKKDNGREYKGQIWDNMPTVNRAI